MLWELQHMFKDNLCVTQSLRWIYILGVQLKTVRLWQYGTMNRHGNPKVPFGAETGPPPVIHENNFFQSTNSRSGLLNPALLNGDSRQSQNSEGIQSVDSSMENADGYYQGRNALLNLDISASNFMKAMNFEAMTGSDENEGKVGIRYICQFCIAGFLFRSSRLPSFLSYN